MTASNKNKNLAAWKPGLQMQTKPSQGGSPRFGNTHPSKNAKGGGVRAHRQECLCHPRPDDKLPPGAALKAAALHLHLSRVPLGGCDFFDFSRKATLKTIILRPTNRVFRNLVTPSRDDSVKQKQKSGGLEARVTQAPTDSWVDTRRLWGETKRQSLDSAEENSLAHVAHSGFRP
jgi:hypothetical protein